MASDNDDFDTIGPTHLAVVDWDNDNHRRSVAASLVSGVYILERDRQDKRHGPEAVAPLWWEFFHFRLLCPLIDDVDCSIFGAIFEYTLKSSQHDTTSNSSTTSIITQSKKAIPHYVVAFRGTLTKGDSVSRDVQHDIHVMKNGFQETSRVEMALRSVRDTVAMAHGSKSQVWLAGHSLGAAMVMHCGKKMTLSGNGGSFLESFLFNPPFISAPIERIKNENVKHGLRFAGSIVTAGLAFAMSVKHPEKEKARSSDDSFTKLSTWVPNLFVHPSDHICSEYIGYFEHQEKLEEFGAGGIGKLAAQHSLGGLVMTALGKTELDSELPLHLIPSACVTVNTSRAPDFKAAHSLKQWWRTDIQLRTKIYVKR